ncbi:MAG: DUF5320 domain-containing protein [bacterium]
MPRFDQTGPLGYGPRTGIGIGHCVREIGCGRGCGIGYRNFGRRWTRTDEFNVLKEEKEMLEKELEEVKAEIKNLEEQK